MNLSEETPQLIPSNFSGPQCHRCHCLCPSACSMYLPLLTERSFLHQTASSTLFWLVARDVRNFHSDLVCPQKVCNLVFVSSRCKPYTCSILLCVGSMLVDCFLNSLFVGVALKRKRACGSIVSTDKYGCALCIYAGMPRVQTLEVSTVLPLPQVSRVNRMRTGPLCCLYFVLLRSSQRVFSSRSQ